MLTALQNDLPFRGFILQGRDAGELPAGYFTVIDNGTQLSECSPSNVSDDFLAKFE